MLKQLFRPLQRQRPRSWLTPSGRVYTLFEGMAAQPHLLIAGATGSGKSVLENGIIATLLHHSPAKVRLILIDPKRVELRRYAALPHVLAYADTAPAILAALQRAREIVEERFRVMQREDRTEYDGADVYIIIDELAALMTTQKRDVLPILQYLGMIARAAHVHMIVCTQTVRADVLPTTLTCNFDSRIALRTSTRQQSRMIIDVPGCESFPSPHLSGEAFCFYRVGADLVRWKIPYITPEEIESLCQWWTGEECIA